MILALPVSPSFGFYWNCNSVSMLLPFVGLLATSVTPSVNTSCNALMNNLDREAHNSPTAGWTYGMVPPRIDAVMGYLTSIQRSLFHRWLPSDCWWSAMLGPLCKCPNTTLGQRQPITPHYVNRWVLRLPNSCRCSVGEFKGGHFRRSSSITVFRGGQPRSERKSEVVYQ